jgi:hypothetical protein
MSGKANICQNIPVSYTKSGWVLLKYIQGSDNWSIWSLLHFDQDLIWILDSQTHHPWFLRKARLDMHAYLISQYIF